jgi:hypothetical protein
MPRLIALILGALLLAGCAPVWVSANTGQPCDQLHAWLYSTCQVKPGSEPVKGWTPPSVPAEIATPGHAVWAFTASYQGSGVEFAWQATVGQAATAAEKGGKWMAVAYYSAEADCEAALVEEKRWEGAHESTTPPTFATCRPAVVVPGTDYWVYTLGNAVRGATPQAMCDLMKEVERQRGSLPRTCHPIALQFLAE